jgi:hypothetical protein
MIPKGITADMLQNTITTGSNVFTISPDDAGGVYTNPKSVSSPPPLGIDPDKTPTGTSVISEPYVDTKPPKSTGNIQGGLYPECLAKWEKVLAVTKFESTQAMEEAKKRFMTDCMTSSTTGTSAIVEPEIVTPISGTSTGTTTTNVILPNLGGFLSSLTGGGAGGGGGATEEDVLTPNKKPFPYWIIAVAVVGGYLIFRKK